MENIGGKYENRIYTHGGVAHSDEMLACALLSIAKGTSEVIRVKDNDQIPPDLEENEYIVDTGGKYDKEKYFDHHQDEEAVNGKCAATLVAETFFPEMLDHKKLGPFLKRIELQDNGGAKNIESEFGFDMRDLSPFMFLESGLKKEFEQNPTAITKLIASIVQNILDFDKEVEAAVKWLNTTTRIETINGIKILVNEINPYGANLPFGQDALNAAKKSINFEKVNIDYTFCERDNGKSQILYRCDNAYNLVDFNQSTASNTLFCHKNGFLLRFIPEDENEWKHLIEEAQVN